MMLGNGLPSKNGAWVEFSPHVIISSCPLRNVSTCCVPPPTILGASIRNEIKFYVDHMHIFIVLNYKERVRFIISV